MTNPDVIKERLREIDENLKILAELKELDKEKFKSDPKIFKLAEHCLQISIQALLDICQYIIASNNWQRPRDNREAINIIAANGIIPRDFAKRILPMAGLRNLLIHEYLEINLDKIYRYLQKLGDFRAFQKHIIKFLKKA